MSDDYELAMPFWIDTDAYTDRDRMMFVAGVEFAMLRRALEGGEQFEGHPIHRENESRVRLMAARLGRRVEIEQSPDEHWSYLTTVIAP